VPRKLLIVLLCLFALAQIGCARRHTRGPRLPGTSNVAATSKAPRSSASTNQVRNAIRSLKERLGNEPGKTAEGAVEPAAPVSSVAATPGNAPSDPRSVGTSGVLSVETRYPAAQPGTQSNGPPPRGRLLTRAGDAVRRAGSSSWTWLAALCLAAGALVVALTLRRARAAN
jgi:hypothetical protein